MNPLKLYTHVSALRYTGPQNPNQSRLNPDLGRMRGRRLRLGSASTRLTTGFFTTTGAGCAVTTAATSSKTLLSRPERLGIFGLGMHSACNQYPALVKSKSNSAAFRMGLNQPLGYRITMRRRCRSDFNYKWVFLAPGSGNRNLQRSKLGLRNVFIFALDHHNYSVFEHWPGLDLEFRDGA
jgi:hypothetical protein